MMFCQVGNFCKILYIAVYRIEEPVGYALAKCLREMCIILSSSVWFRYDMTLGYLKLTAVSLGGR